MKKLLTFLFILMMALCLCDISLAMTEREFLWQCQQKMGENTYLFTIAETDGVKTFCEQGTIEKGAYVVVGDMDKDLMMHQIFFLQGDQVQEGYVKKNAAFADAKSQVEFADGSKVYVGQLLYRNQEELTAYLKATYPNKRLPGEKQEGPVPTQKPASPTARPASSGAAAIEGNKLMAGTLDGGSAQVVQLGVYQSKVMKNGKEELALTRDLTLPTNMATGEQLASIYAPNTGKCSLRESDSSSGKLVKNCTAGAVVLVLEMGEEFSKIFYDGDMGYVLTSCLALCDASGEVPGKGTLALNGKTDGRSTINIRNTTSTGSYKVAEWKTGTQVTLLSQEDGWYEVENDGIRGYVMEKFVK